MILSNDDALKVIIKRPNRKLIESAQKYTKKLLMHVKGVGLDAYIEKITAFEKEDVILIRKKYAVSNQPMFARIHRPLDKVFTAKGGSVYYNLGEAATAKFKKELQKVVMGYPLKDWLKVFWMPAMSYDPMGLIMVEVDPNNVAYPTYKSVMDVFEYKLNGRDVEYIIFKNDARIDQLDADGVAPKNELYRIVDDISDRIVRIQGDHLIEIDGETFPNYFMKVPATIVSTIYDPVKGMFVSHDDDIIELADQFLREGSVKNIMMNYHGFPKAWEYQSACVECKGTGKLDGRPCMHCKGSGIKSKSFPEETIRLPVPTSKDQPTLAPDVAGYIEPPIEGIQMYTEALEALEDLMFETKWGTHQADDRKKGASETATGKFIDVQPVNDRLGMFSDAEELIETFVTDLLGQKLFGTSYGGASITAGRRYMIETPDEIWLKLQNARKEGAPTSALYYLYDYFLQAEFGDKLELEKMQKLAKIEPLPFVKFEEFSRLNFPMPIMMKKYWWELWMNQKSAHDIISGDLTALQADFADFCEQQDDDLQALILADPSIIGAPAPGAPAPAPEKKAA